MHISSIQFEIKDKRTKAESIQHMSALLDSIPSSELILMPEIWTPGYFSFDRYKKEAEPLDGPTVAYFRKKARERESTILMGSIVEQEGENFYNTSVLIDPQGEITGRYRKIHLFGFQSEEAQILTKGEEAPVFKTTLGTVGLSTCYDLRFPELFRSMMVKGASLFLVVSAWPAVRLNAWRLFCQARAHENFAFLIACNSAGSNQGKTFAGHSMVVSPGGEILAEAAAGEEVLSMDINIKEGLKLRNEFPALQDRVLV